MLTVYGATAATIMVTSYAFEDRHPLWIVVFAFGCAATALYGILTQAWIFAALESIWAAIAIHRYRIRPATG